MVFYNRRGQEAKTEVIVEQLSINKREIGATSNTQLFRALALDRSLLLLVVFLIGSKSAKKFVVGVSDLGVDFGL